MFWGQLIENNEYFITFQFQGINESALRSGTSGPGIISAADPDIGELTLSEMNPDEIRKELKRYISHCLVWSRIRWAFILIPPLQLPGSTLSWRY